MKNIIIIITGKSTFIQKKRIKDIVKLMSRIINSFAHNINGIYITLKDSILCDSYQIVIMKASIVKINN